MVKKRRKINKKIIIPVVIVVILILLIASNSITGFFTAGTNNRPKFCDKNGCIPPEILSKLPPYPNDFSQVDILVEASKYPVLENFTEGTPDEYYYAQPDFYPGWESQGIPFYTILNSDYSAQYLGVKGYGAYPGDIIIQSKEDALVKPGTDLEMVTYVHASWGVTKYQGMKLETFYPESGISGFGIIKVQQDPNKVKDYFQINIDPNILLIEPSWPLFYSGWTQKVKIKIHINEDAPAGSYLIGISPVDPPYDLQMQWLRQYKFGYTNAGGIGLDRPTYQVFIVVS